MNPLVPDLWDPSMASGAVVIRLPVPLMLFMDTGHMSLGLNVNKQDSELPGP